MKWKLGRLRKTEFKMHLFPKWKSCTLCNLQINTIGNVLNWVGKRTGLGELVGTLNMQLTEAGKIVETKLAEISGMFFRSSDEWATTVGHNMVKPLISASEQAEVAKTTISNATREVQALQQQIVDEGVQFATELKTPYQVMTEQVQALDAALAAGRISAQQHATAHARAAAISANGYASMASDITGSLQQAFGKNKAVAIAGALVSTYQAATNALANIPAPFNLAAAGAALAAGMAQVSAIRSTSAKSKDSSKS